MENKEFGKVGGWEAPCVAFDYRKMEREAEQECAALLLRLQRLKELKPADAEADLLRRREVCILTDIYYEQRHNARMFRQRAEERNL